MPVEKLPGGTRGTRTPPSLLGRVMTPLMVRFHRRAGDRFQGMDLLYLTTVGARSGTPRTTPVARFDDGEGGWFVVASAGGAARHPGWYHNIVAHPDEVRVEASGKDHRVQVDQL
jgi:deazaflavin-dependent oxidoreductase (nitroreductase family)